jgi:hypothetical protein
MFAVIKTFVTDISAYTGRNDFIFDIWLWHGDLYRVSPFQVYCTSTSCFPCDLEFFMFAVMKILVTDISAFTGRDDFIFDIWLWYGNLYRVVPFQVYRTSTSCLPRDLDFFMFVVIKTFVTDISASTGRPWNKSNWYIKRQRQRHSLYLYIYYLYHPVCSGVGV